MAPGTVASSAAPIGRLQDQIPDLISKDLPRRGARCRCWEGSLAGGKLFALRAARTGRRRYKSGQRLARSRQRWMRELRRPGRLGGGAGGAAAERR
eukprot:scaffold4564_cov369-Prasinococcus_capsulatus_cf.AAC.8